MKKVRRKGKRGRRVRRTSASAFIKSKAKTTQVVKNVTAAMGQNQPERLSAQN
jgi:hypothetical protein